MLRLILLCQALFFGFAQLRAAHQSSQEAPTRSPGKEVNRRFFMWFSDVHVDPYYGVQGSYKDQCGVCHRKVGSNWTSNFSKEEADGGPMGTLGCDPPPSLWKSALVAASREALGAEFVLFTGDLVRHRQSDLLNPFFNVSAIIGNSSELLVDHFPQMSTKQIVMGTLGNDDSPMDYEINITNASEPNPWAQEVGSRFEEVGAMLAARKDEYEFGAFFSAKVGGLKILSIDTLVYSVKHLPTKPVPKDPFGQFEWLREQLQEAYDSDEHVWIAGHILPGLETYSYTHLWHEEYLTAYLGIVQDPILGSVVRAQLFGHVHAEEVRILPLAPPEAGPVLLMGSVSPIYFNNPSFRIVEYDEDTGKLLNVKVFWANLSASSNSSDDVEWLLGYNFTGSYPSLAQGSSGFILNKDVVAFAQSMESSWQNKTESEWTAYVEWYKTRIANDLMLLSDDEDVLVTKEHGRLCLVSRERAARKYFCALNISSQEVFHRCAGLDDNTTESEIGFGEEVDEFQEMEAARSRHWRSIAAARDKDAIDALLG